MSQLLDKTCDHICNFIDDGNPISLYSYSFKFDILYLSDYEIIYFHELFYDRMVL